jgi:hypothetical protein
MQDKEEWIDERAQDLALKHFDDDFSDLTHKEQMYCWNLAEDDYNNLMADKADALYEMAVEAQLMRQMDEKAENTTT